MFDILFISSNKDFNKLKYVYNSLIENLTDKFNNIYLISNVKFKLNDNVINYTDNEVLDINRNQIRHRPNWIYQQYLKLFQDITDNDYYLVVDADVIFNKKITILENDKPSFLFGRDQFHQPYFTYSKQMLGIDKLYPHSFINEIMLFDKNVIDDILSNYDNNEFEFIKKSNEIINSECYISEYELYGNFVYKNYKDKYNYKNLNSYMMGRSSEWNDNEINHVINTMKNTDYDIFTIHTWN